MTAKKLLNINGDFKENSPLIRLIGIIHKIFIQNKIPYAIVGRLSVIHHGSYRTTNDIDILLDKTNWPLIKKCLENNGFKAFYDSAIHIETEICIDILFSGDSWVMPIKLPNPENCNEYDSELSANFINLFHLLELKMGAYMQKKKEDGIEIAAKDLYDIVELIKYNIMEIDKDFIKKFILPYEKN